MEEKIIQLENVRIRIREVDCDELLIWDIGITCFGGRTVPFGKGQLTAGSYQVIEKELDEVVEFFRDVYRGKKVLSDKPMKPTLMF